MLPGHLNPALYSARAGAQQAAADTQLASTLSAAEARPLTPQQADSRDAAPPPGVATRRRLRADACRQCVSFILDRLSDTGSAPHSVSGGVGSRGGGDGLDANAAQGRPPG